jgi:flagellar motility protein MotE (MotC chaperone)
MRQPNEPKRRRVRLLPLTMTMISLLLLVKVNELYVGSRELREIYGIRDAVAEEAKPEEAAHGGEKKPTEDHAAEGDKPTEKGGKEPGEGGAHGETKTAEEGHGDAKDDGHGGKPKEVEEPRTHGTGKSTIKEIEAMKARDAQPRFTQSELDLLQNLVKRRSEIEQREKDLEIKAKVLEATEKRIGDKIDEMKTLEAQLSQVIAQYNEKQDTQIKSLVKIYESMKPDEAAAIFNEMEMPILLEVIAKMSERKVAPVLANMSPKKARDVTQELADKRKKTLPEGAAASKDPAVR